MINRGEFMINQTLILYCIAAYLIGSIPFALVIGKVFYHTDVREFGSKNLGGTNAGRVLGKKAGISIILLDIFKAMLIMLIGKQFGNLNFEQLLIIGFFVNIGHALPIWAKFKGGKCVSTFFGFLFGIVYFNPDYYLLLVSCIAAFIFILFVFKMVSLASILSATYCCVFSLIYQNWYLSIALDILTAIIIYRHRANIDRIKNKTESKVSWL